MSGWIKIDKGILSDLRFRRMVRLRVECNAGALHESTAVTHLLGAITQLWIYADEHIRDDNTMRGTFDDIDHFIGITGFCELMPSDWLKVIDPDNVQLPDWLEHNGSVAKQRALTQKRVEKHRSAVNSNSSSLRSSNAGNGHALPDQTRLDQTRPKKKNPSAHRTAPSDEQFLDLKLIYPNRSGDQGWPKALRAAHARMSEGHSWDEILDGVRRYAAYIRSTGNQDSAYIKQAATFLGPDLFFQQPWDPPKSKAENHRDTNIENSQEWLHAN